MKACLAALLVALSASCSTQPQNETRDDLTGQSRGQSPTDGTFTFYQRSEADYTWDKGKSILPSTGERILSLLSKARPWPPNGRRPFADPGESERTPSPMAALEVASRGRSTIYHLTQGGALVYRSSNIGAAGKERFIVSPDDRASLLSLIDPLRDKDKVPLTKRE